MTEPLRPHFSEFCRSAEPPAGIRIPAPVFDLHTILQQAEEGCGRTCTNAFLRSGLFTSYLREEAPHDIDIVVHMPEFLQKMRELEDFKKNFKAESYSDLADRNDGIEYLASQIFPPGYPLTIHAEDVEPLKRDKPVLGDVSGFSFLASQGGKGFTVDIICTSNPVTPEQFFMACGDSPIRSVAFDHTRKDYVYHRDFAAHAQEWVFEPFGRPSQASLRRAAFKGMKIDI